MFKEFNVKRILSILRYLQDYLEGTPENKNYMKLIKLVYFADRYHMRKYGTFITHDDYYAIKLGPIPTRTLNIVTLNDFYLQLELSRIDCDYVKKNIYREGNNITINADVDFRLISKSAMKALDFALKTFSKFDQFQLSDITHDYDEWKRHRNHFDSGKKERKDIQLNDFFKTMNFEDSGFVHNFFKEDPFKEDPNFLKLAEEDFIANKVIC